MKRKFLLLLGFMFLFVVKQTIAQNMLYPGVTEANRVYEAPATPTPPSIDGNPNDAVWDLAPWAQVQFIRTDAAWGWPAEEIQNVFFSGPEDYFLRWKMLWDYTTYYILIEITDDVTIFSPYGNTYAGRQNLEGDLQVPDEIVGKMDPTHQKTFNYWRTDAIEWFITDTTKAYKASWNRLIDKTGMYKHIYPGAASRTEPWALIVVDRNNQAEDGWLKDGTSAGTVSGTKTFIEYKDVPWAEMIPLKPHFGGNTGDTILMDMGIMEADTYLDRRDYGLTLGSRDHGAHTQTSQWINIILTGQPPEVSAKAAELSRNDFQVYPNPNSTGYLKLNKVTDASIYSLTGALVLKSVNTSEVDVSGLNKGIYMIKDTEGNIRKLVIK